MKVKEAGPIQNWGTPLNFTAPMWWEMSTSEPTLQEKIHRKSSKWAPDALGRSLLGLLGCIRDFRCLKANQQGPFWYYIFFNPFYVIRFSTPKNHRVPIRSIVASSVSIQTLAVSIHPHQLVNCFSSSCRSFEGRDFRGRWRIDC